MGRLYTRASTASQGLYISANTQYYAWANELLQTQNGAVKYGYLYRTAENLKGIAIKQGAVGYATGGIATGSLSGYQATLHGTEAVIPLGDGNSVTAHLTSPLPPAPNLIAREAGDSLALRQALAELQAEVHALRSEAQVASAATVGELKDHNRRERRRDVVGAKVEVIS